MDIPKLILVLIISNYKIIQLNILILFNTEHAKCTNSGTGTTDIIKGMLY